MNKSYLDLESKTAIVTQGIESPARLNAYYAALAKQARMIDAGLITAREARRAIFEAF